MDAGEWKREQGLVTGAAEASLDDLQRRLDLSEDEKVEMKQALDDSEGQLARTVAEARQLETALADGKDALSRRDSEWRQLLAIESKRLEGLAAELRVRDERLATQSQQIARLEAAGTARTRRWHSLTQFGSWLLRPTSARRGYISDYRRLRRSDLFDADSYLVRYPDVRRAGQNPLMHYIEHGRREGRQAVGPPPEPWWSAGPGRLSTAPLHPAPLPAMTESMPPAAESAAPVRRTRRLRSLTQFGSWLLRPTAARRRYISRYFRLRRSDLFDADFYVSRYPDVSQAGLNPLMHYIEFGRREGREPVGSPPELRSSTGRGPLGAGESVVRTGPKLPSTPAREVSAAALQKALAGHVPKTSLLAVARDAEGGALSLSGYRTVPFPRTEDGSSGGSEATGNTALIANLEATRASGVEFLLVPASERQLLERNPRFRTHLVSRYPSVFDSEDGVCLALHARDESNQWRTQLAELADLTERETGHEASVLDWDSGLQLAETLHGCNVFTLSQPELPHLDASVDVVAVTTESEGKLAEAARVARQGVLEVSPDGAPPRLVTTAAFTERGPTVSIVIPCHEQFAHTEACIRALGETLPSWFRGEILLIDDASSSETVAELERLAGSNPHVRLLRNEVNAGFLASVNRAVDEAVGEFVVLLNNDTIPLPGWLPPLLAPFATRDDVGAVGGRLVYPDGHLQEAGGLVFRDGSAAKFGYGDPDPDFPLFTTPREVDYCSGCLLAFRRAFFLESGGFDPAYGFGFYEDTDFCFRVRSLNRVVLYEPESVIVHVEGASAGTDLTQGAKRFQATNASLFTERWHEALEHQHERPEELDGEALRRLSRRLGG